MRCDQNHCPTPTRNRDAAFRLTKNHTNQRLFYYVQMWNLEGAEEAKFTTKRPGLSIMLGYIEDSKSTRGFTSADGLYLNWSGAPYGTPLTECEIIAMRRSLLEAVGNASRCFRDEVRQGLPRLREIIEQPQGNGVSLAKTMVKQLGAIAKLSDVEKALERMGAYGDACCPICGCRFRCCG